MAINKNIALVCIAVVMTLAMWMVPETISAESHKQRLLLTTYNTNPTRTAAVTKYCASITSRSELISNDEKTTAQTYKNQLAAQLKLNGNDFINTAINGGDVAGDVKAQQTAFGLFIGFFVVGFVILIIQWMCLCCCCCCPSCCPSKCCQKDENEQYTKCELYWPSIFLILLLLLIIVVCAIGLAKASTFKTGIEDLQCSTAILFDDIVNGNVTADGSAFFTGIIVMVSTINDLNTNLNDISNNMTNLNNGLTTIVNDMNTALGNIQQVPQGVASGGNAVINYASKINEPYGSTTQGTVSSAFVTALGSSNTGGIIGTIYSTVQTGYNTLSGIKSSAAAFASGAAGFSSSVSSITSDLNNVQTQINNINTSVGDGLGLMDTPKTMGTLVINLIYGIALGLAALALLGVILMTFCDKYKCRYLMYFSCVILFFFGILGFLIAIIFSIIVPVMYFLCEWLDVTVTSTGFSTNTQKFITDPQVQNILSSCLVGGTGDIMAAVGGASIGSTINNLTSAITYTSAFNTTAQAASITTAVTNITSTIDSFRNGVIPDVTDSDSITALTLVSKMQDASFSGCSASPVDSYVPSMTNTSMIGCSISASTVDASTCTSSANFDSSAAGCVGCIDTSLILNAYYTGLTQGQWKTKLDTKYGAGCTWNTYFGNVWDNYYRVKLPAMNTIKGRWNTAATSLNTVVSDFTPVNSTMDAISTTLVNAFDPILNPKYGLIAGINCKIIGEDLQTMISSVCVSNFNTLYITRLLMGIAAFGILFAMCCIVCSGVRHFKHSERKDKVSPNFFGDKNSFENTDAAFRP